MRVPCGVLLAGGGSTRFGGTHKGLAPFGSGRLADQPLAALLSCCDDVIVAANDADAATWFPGHRVVRDVTPGQGALGALETALSAAGSGTVLVCAWDMPFASGAVLRALAGVVAAGAPCCVPAHADGALEPLCAAYDAACLGLVRQLLADGERAAHAVVARSTGVRWPIGAALEEQAAERAFFNVNTPDDLRRATSWASLPQTCP